MTDSTASIKIIPFSGKKADWPVWSEKFLARAKRRGYRDHLLGIVETPTDATQSDKIIYKKSLGSDGFGETGCFGNAVL